MPQELEAIFDGTAFQLETPLNLAAGTKVRIIVEEVVHNKQKQSNKLSILLTSLTAKDAQTRSQAAIALGKLGSEDAIPALSNTLITDQAPEVRRNAAKALGMIGNTETEAKR